MNIITFALSCAFYVTVGNITTCSIVCIVLAVMNKSLDPFSIGINIDTDEIF